MNSRTDYDNYIIYNPEGKVKQLEFINNAVSLGNTVVALKNDNIGVLITHNVKRTQFAELQKKVFTINTNTLFTFSGITNDGNKIVKYLKNKSVNEHVIKGRQIHPVHVFDDLCYDAGLRTMVNGYRLYGVQGLLLTDYSGISLVKFDPQGSAYELRAASIGNRSQSCRTILEDCAHEFDACDAEGLISLGLRALYNAYPEPGLLTAENVDIWCIEKNKQAVLVPTEKYIK